MTLVGWGLILLATLVVLEAVALWLGIRQLPRLADVGPTGRGPRVSIVVAARNEARGIERAARALAAQRYPDFEIIAVDDRSTDSTGAILDRLAGEDPHFRVVHLRELPPGWLGKNHALHSGAALASGEWVLFTDADVVMHPETLARAIGFAEARGADHLAVLPELRVPGIALRAFITAFATTGLALLRPWKVRDVRTRQSAGVGAFNLVRASAYKKAGGHAPIRLRPDDDLKLGKILKRSGARSEVVLGNEMISVEWYHSLGEAIDGMTKNSFSVVEYRVLPILLGPLGFLLLVLGPLFVAITGVGAPRALGLLCVASLVVLHAIVPAAPRRYALLYPLGHFLMVWISMRAMVLNLSQRGIVWRGTFYPLSELRKNRV